CVKGSSEAITRNPNCDLSPTGFEYIAMNILGASKRLLSPLPATETSRVEPICVYRMNAVPISISMPPFSYIFEYANIGTESGSHDVPEPSRFIGSPMFTVEDIGFECAP